MPKVMESDREEWTHVGALLFPNFEERWIKVLESLKSPEQGEGLLSEAMFRKIAEEFYPEHIQEFVDIWMEHRLEYFIGPGEQKRKKAQIQVREKLEKLGIFTWF